MSIAGLTSLSPPESKSSSILKALPMSLSVVLNAAGLTKHDVLTVAATTTRHGIKSSAYHTQCHIQNEVDLEEQAA